MIDPNWNHNGAINAIAGILNDGGNVLGMMPHPENHVEAALGATDGRGLFAGLVDYLGQERVVAGYMLDTNLFNRVADSTQPLDSLYSLNLYTTHIQFDELASTTDKARRTDLVKVFHQLSPEQVPTHSAVFDISRWDECGWGSNDGLFEKMLDRLRACDQKKKARKDIKNQLRDILIAETAIKNGFTLITNDQCLRQVAEAFGCSVKSDGDLLLLK
jgi:predicted nucleic acid-binding protein